MGSPGSPSTLKNVQIPHIPREFPSMYDVWVPWTSREFPKFFVRSVDSPWFSLAKLSRFPQNELPSDTNFKLIYLRITSIVGSEQSAPVVIGSSSTRGLCAKDRVFSLGRCSKIFLSSDLIRL